MIRELTGVLEEIWHTLLAPDWPRLRALLEADVAFHSRRLAEVGLGGLLPEINRRCGWRAGTLTVDSNGEHERHLGGQGLVLMPSVFSWPDVVSGFDPPWQPTLVYPARGIGGLWTDSTAHSPRRSSGCWAGAGPACSARSTIRRPPPPSPTGSASPRPRSPPT